MRRLFGGRPELVDTLGIIDYGSLIYVGLQRSRTAREAIKVMTELVQEYGYYSSGESFTIADPNEIWIMEMIGKGPGHPGSRMGSCPSAGRLHFGTCQPVAHPSVRYG